MRSGISGRLAAWIAAVVALVVGVVWHLLLRQGTIPGRVPWMTILFHLGAAGVVVGYGWGVRSWQRRDDRSAPVRRRIDPLRATRTLALAQAAILTGSVLTGVWAGQALALLPDAGFAPFRPILARAALAAGSAFLLLVAGLVVQRWCRVRADENDDDPRGPGLAVGLGPEDLDPA